MGRYKKQITKNSYLRIRVEDSLKKAYLMFCKQNEITHSVHLRKLIIKAIR